MGWFRVLCVMGLCLGCCVPVSWARAAVASAGDAAVELARAYQLDALAPTFAELATPTLRAELAHLAPHVVAATITQMAQTRAAAGHPIDSLQDPALRAAVETALRERIHAALPDLVRRYVYEGLLRDAAGPQLVALEPIIAEIQRRATTAINAQLDQVVSRYYDRLVDQISPCVFPERHPGACPLPERIRLTDLRGTIDRVVDGKALADGIAQQLGQVFGPATVQGIRDRLDDALKDRLPPALQRALRRGPAEVRRYVAMGRGYLPGAQLMQLRDRLLNTRILTLPNPVYGSMLAGAAAQHFAKAVCGPGCVDPYEIKRGTEVIRVLVWQLKHREQIVLSLGQLGDLAGAIGGALGVPPVAQWGRMGRGLARVRAQVREVQRQVQAIDAKVMTGAEKIQAGIDGATRAVEERLRAIQHELTQPAREVVTTIDADLTQMAGSMKARLPERFNGVPPSWAAFKRTAGLPRATLGRWGQQTPLQATHLDVPVAQVRAGIERFRVATSSWLARFIAAFLERNGWLAVAGRRLGV